MSYKAIKTVVLLILAVIPVNHGFGEDRMQVELKLSVYPETVAIGDTCYVLVTAINHSDKTALVKVPSFSNHNIDQMVQFDLCRQGKTWRGTFEPCPSIMLVLEHETIYYDYIIPNGETIHFLVMSFQVPPLEDLYQDAFWEEQQKELKDHPDGLSFEFGVEFMHPRLYPPDWQQEVSEKSEKFSKDNPNWLSSDVELRDRIEEWTTGRTQLTQNVTVKFRNDKEMEMIDQWYQNTPKRYFPVIVEKKYIRKNSRVPVSFRDTPWWKLINIGNRYPGAPNAPETWQGWKELEDSITPSTMRDEIRLTRILIQYCDTEDDAVLKELKECSPI